MSTPFTTYAFPLSSIQANATTNRTYPTRATDIINVKDFGAVGDGLTDDTTALQNAFTAAMPPEQADFKPIKAVFIPNGTYIISRPLYAQGVGGAHIFGAGMYSTKIQNNGGTADASFTASLAISDTYSSIMTVTAIASGSILVGGQVSGGTVTAGTVITKQLTGAAGSTGTYRVTPPQTVGATAGLAAAYSTCLFMVGVTGATFEEMSLQAATGGIGFDWTGDNNTLSASAQPGYSLFSHLNFVGGGDIGMRIGVGGPNNDTSTWVDCLAGGLSVAGFHFVSQNVVACTIVGGNIQQCPIGVWMTGGTCNAILGTSFQNSTTYDIQIDGGNEDCVFVCGVSSESRFFLNLNTQTVNVQISGCGQRAEARNPGVFVNAAGVVSIDGCRARGGRIAYQNAPLKINNSQIAPIDWTTSTPTNPHVEISNSTFGNAADGLGHYIRKQRITAAGTRTYDIEATSLSTTGFYYDSLNTNLGQDYMDVTFTNASPTVITFGSNGHGFVNGTKVAFTNTGGLIPTGITADRTYYVTGVSSTTTTQFTIATTSGSSNINTTSSGTGTQHCWLVRDYAIGDRVLNNTVITSSVAEWICTTAGMSVPTSSGFGAAVFSVIACS